MLAVLAVAAAAAWAIWGVSFPLLAVLMIEGAVALYLKTPIREAIVAVESAYEDLKGLSLLLRRIEAERFDAPPLRALLEKLSSHALSASATFTKLATIVNFVEARRNPILAPFLLLIMYPLQTALAAERWRSAHGAAIPAWLETFSARSRAWCRWPSTPTSTLAIRFRNSPPARRPSRRSIWATR